MLWVLDCFASLAMAMYLAVLRFNLNAYALETAYLDHLSDTESSDEDRYRRNGKCRRCAGESLLDAGCSSGFLPLILSERLTALRNVAGIDIRAEPFAVARAIAQERHLENVYFKQVDLLSDEMGSFGPFDTVTMLHVLEHFSEADMYGVLAKLLRLWLCAVASNDAASPSRETISKPRSPRVTRMLSHPIRSARAWAPALTDDSSFTTGRPSAWASSPTLGVTAVAPR